MTRFIAIYSAPSSSETEAVAASEKPLRESRECRRWEKKHEGGKKIQPSLIMEIQPVHRCVKKNKKSTPTPGQEYNIT